MNDRNRELLGMEVRGTDGTRVGRVIECNPESFVIEKGLIFKRDTFIPYDEIAGVNEGVITLRDAGRYYREGGDIDDGHWTREIGRESRTIHGDGGTAAHDVGLPRESGRSAELAPEEEDEAVPLRGDVMPGMHVPVSPTTLDRRAGADAAREEGATYADPDDPNSPDF